MHHQSKKRLSGDLPKQMAISLKHSYHYLKRIYLQETLKENVKCNLSKDERGALNEWGKNNLFNKNSNLVMRLQDKGNRFVEVDKELTEIRLKNK